ncbi:MAG: Holliday junction branch migration protein RuvA [bacterium]
MIDHVTGVIKEINDKIVILQTGPFCLALHVPNSKGLYKDSQAALYTYMHWNAENGPSFFAFQTQLERKVFLLIITCPKIGPSIASGILSTFSASQFLEIVSTHDEAKLSTISGIGEKKAEQIIVQLKHKVQKMLSSGQFVLEAQESFVQWQNVNDVLASLNYSNQEISKAMAYLGEKYKGQNCALDQLIRAALSFLSGTI